MAAGTALLVAISLALPGARRPGPALRARDAGETGLSRFAGSPFRGPGSLDGKGAAAVFKTPLGLARDPDGNLLVADPGDNAIRRIAPDGKVTTLGKDEVPAGALNLPAGVAAAADGSIYVTDFKVFSPVQQVHRFLHGKDQPLKAPAAGYQHPLGVAVGPDGTVYVADAGIQITDPPSKTAVYAIAADGSLATLAAPKGGYREPAAVAADPDGNVFVADAGGPSDSSRPGVYRVSSAGAVSRMPAPKGGYGRPVGVAVDGQKVYVMDCQWQRVFECSASGQGPVASLAGTGEIGNADGPGDKAAFSFNDTLGGMALDGDGDLALADGANNRVRTILLQADGGGPRGSVSTLAGGAATGAADGPALAATFDQPQGLAVDASGTVYVAGGAKVRSITRKKRAWTVATLPVPDFGRASGVAVDGKGTVYVADSSQKQALKLTPPAGGGSRWSVEPLPAPARGYAEPVAVAVSADGQEVLVADRKHGSYLIFKGRALSVSVTAREAPAGVAADGKGNFYIADLSTQSIYRFSHAGWSRLAGTGKPGSQDGPGAQASFNNPQGLAVDASGENLYVADTGNNVIRHLTLKGRDVAVETLVGRPGQPATVEGPLPASLYQPAGVALGPAGTGLAGILLVTVPDAVMQATVPQP